MQRGLPNTSIAPWRMPNSTTTVSAWLRFPILPLITETNHQAEVRKNRIVTASLVIVSILSLGFLAMAFFAFKMNKRLAKSRREIKSQNTLLDELNQKLLNTNKRRETYMHLFMDISAVYIKKLDDYRKLVSRKIKAKQTADLLTAINSYKLAEEGQPTSIFASTRHSLTYIRISWKSSTNCCCQKNR